MIIKSPCFGSTVASKTTHRCSTQRGFAISGPHQQEQPFRPSGQYGWEQGQPLYDEMQIDKYFIKRAYSNNPFRQVRAKVNNFLNKEVMESLFSKINPEDYLKGPKTLHRSHRDELVDKFVLGINRERLGTQYKPILAKEVALRINKNPFLKGRDGEVELLYKTCEKKGSFKYFFYICPLHPKKPVS